jgi:DNA-binding protein HU-beta
VGRSAEALSESGDPVATKAELIQSVADRAGVNKKEAEAVLAAFFDHAAEQVKQGEKVGWPGFGAFSMTERAARKGRNPATGETIKIKRSRSLKLSTSAPMKAWLLTARKKR